MCKDDDNTLTRPSRRLDHKMNHLHNKKGRAAAQINPLREANIDWDKVGPYGTTPVRVNGVIVKYTNKNGEYDLYMRKIRK